jgi:hypothetical protein
MVELGDASDSISFSVETSKMPVSVAGLSLGNVRKQFLYDESARDEYWRHFLLV